MTEMIVLQFYILVGYGSGDIAGNVVYAFLSSFVMIYLTNTVCQHPLRFLREGTAGRRIGGYHRQKGN